jgi:hypothetical protein
MKKFLYMVLGLLSLLTMATIVGMQINALHPFLNFSTDVMKMLNYVNNFGAMILLASWSLVYFWGKGLKVIMSILVLLIVALGVVAFCFPELITKVFGA